MSARVECCATARHLRAAVAGAPVAVVQLRVLPVPSMFPAALREAAAAIPYPVACVVAPPSVAAEAGLPAARLGQALVMASGLLLGRLDEGAGGEALRRLLAAGLSPFLGAAGEAADDDPFAVLGIGPGATLAEARAAWRGRLAQYHPDRFAGAGEKIRQVAHAETQRLNAAFRAVARGKEPDRR